MALFIILLSQSLFLQHEPYLPSANPRLSTAGGAEGKQEGTREMSCLPVQLGNLPNHQPVIYLADGTQSRSDIHYFHQPNTLLGWSQNISLSKHTWLQKWHCQGTSRSRISEYSGPLWTCVRSYFEKILEWDMIFETFDLFWVIFYKVNFSTLRRWKLKKFPLTWGKAKYSNLLCCQTGFSVSSVNVSDVPGVFEFV